MDPLSTAPVCDMGILVTDLDSACVLRRAFRPGETLILVYEPPSGSG